MKNKYAFFEKVTQVRIDKSIELIKVSLLKRIMVFSYDRSNVCVYSLSKFDSLGNVKLGKDVQYEILQVSDINNIIVILTKDNELISVDYT